MLNKKTIKNILLEVESCCYNYEEYLQEVISEVLNDSASDIKYIIARENDNGYLTLYKYNESDYIEWLYNEFCYEFNTYNDINIDALINNYGMVRGYAQKNFIDYYIENDILNFINVRKFRKKLYNNKSLLYKIINNIRINVQNYADNDYLTSAYNLNKKLYHELKKIQSEV